ncbi:hypothetical protein Xen7305DRAFT_00030310 [Xenococcus sp. PCC 7305]|uniref:hypothetical protein n=1 Tax=Xenococcus sp. PCC 7305 TaxID=102125 RepID=UPI0002AC05FF|nr:hypothetical protein [Xenococcus sp. PCC 7305]ELS03310.1 hypothetical protein Xen7305DRAFT_00030310 [Xenococcus sp. PCC 7305]
MATQPQNRLQKEAEDQIFTPNLIVFALCFVIALAGFGYILTTLPGAAKLPPGVSPVCVLGGWKIALIITHVLTFALIPLAMRVFYQSLKRLGVPNKSIFASQLGLSFIMVSIASEIGWHVTQCWYYQNQFTMLNFMFYFFLISAFALWAGGLVEQETFVTHTINIVFALLLLAVSILYPLGYEANNASYKIPIYIALTLVFTVLTYRGYKLLQTWKIILFPLFSVGVNLAFIFLLDKYGGTLSDPNIPLNALFHILHDFGGTEAGVLIFTWLVYQKGVEAKNLIQQQ